MQYKTLQEILQANTQWYCYDGEPTPADFTQMCNEVNNEVRNYVDCLLDRLETWQSIVTEDIKNLCEDTHTLWTKYRESYILCVENLLLRLREEIERHSKVLDLQTLDNATLYRMGVYYSSWDDVEFSTREDAKVKCEQLRKEKKSFVAFPDCFKNVWVVIENKADGQLQGSTNKNATESENEGTNKSVEPQLPYVNGGEYERKVYEQAQKAKYLQYEQGKWKWNTKKGLVGYLLGKLYCGDKIIEPKLFDDTPPKYIRGNVKPPKDKIKEIFGIDINNIRPRDPSNSTKETPPGPPKGWEDIDKLFIMASR